MNTPILPIIPALKWVTNLPIASKLILVIYIGFISVSTNPNINTSSFESKWVRILCIIITLAWSCLYFATNKTKVNLSKHCVLALIIFFISQFLSTIFSEHIVISTVRCVEIFQALMICLVAIASKQLKSDELFMFHLKILTAIGTLILFESLLFPAQAWHPIKGAGLSYNYMLQGVYPSLNANTVGLLGGLIASAYFPLIFITKNKKIHILVFFIGAGITLLSYSRSSAISLIFSMLLIFFLLNKTKFCLFIVCIILMISTFSPNIVNQIEMTLKRGQKTNSVIGVTADRPLIWQAVWENNKTSILGHGPSAAFKSPPLSYYYGWGHAHNSFFQTLADTGWLGVVALYSLIFSIALRLYKMIKSRVYPYKKNIALLSVLSVFSFLVIKTFGHSTFTTFGYDFVALITIIVFLEKEQLKHMGCQTVNGKNKYKTN